MPDYGHDLLFGTVLVAAAGHSADAVALARVADRSGLDLVSVPDHPYRPDLLDAWTVLAVIAASTTRVRVFPNVANLPLRPPAMLARTAMRPGPAQRRPSRTGPGRRVVLGGHRSRRRAAPQPR